MKTHEIFVTIQFVAGNLKGMIIQDYLFYGIVESDIPNTTTYMQTLIDNQQIIHSYTKSSYVIKKFEIREIKR